MGTRRASPKPSSAKWSRTHSAAFAHSSGLIEVPGFRSFKFLKSETGEEYLVLTEWNSRADFEAWTQSDAFSRAHSGSNPNSPVKSQLSNYEVLIERLLNGETLDTPVPKGLPEEIGTPLSLEERKERLKHLRDTLNI